MKWNSEVLKPLTAKVSILFLPLFLPLCLCVSVVKISAQGLPLAKPEAVGMNSAKLGQIETLINADIADKKLPGGVVIVGHRGKIVYRKAFGNRSLVPNVEKMTVDTIFDVASLTKPVATATSIMILVEQGKLRLNDTVGKFIPEIEDEQAKRVTILQLLTHTSGYRPDFDLGEKWTGRDGMLAALKKEKLRNPPGTRFVYSDIGFIVLDEILYRVTGSFVSGFIVENLSARLGLYRSGFFGKAFFRDTPIWGFAGHRATLPKITDAFSYEAELVRSVAPTENIKGQSSYLGSSFMGDEKTGGQILRGQVHDPTAYRMSGIAGHAGLFSTADDLARYCQMLLNSGAVPDQVRTGSGSDRVPGSRRLKNPVATAPGSDRSRRILSAQTVAKMTAPYVVSEDGATRGLGWDMNTSFSSNRGDLFPLGSFGHTGFTGTSIWIDRVSQTFVVFLSNRVHPDGKGDVTPLRAKISTVVASAIEDTPFEKYKQAEAEYNAAVAAQIPKFRQLVDSENKKQLSANSYRLTANIQTVLNGIDVLEKENFKSLEGMRIGLITNHTGRNLNSKPTIDILKEAPNVKLTALFSPEHGIRGQADDKVSDTKDEKTGLPVYSLYGETRRPKPEQLKDIDAIVFDIQDIGARFYTYISTLQNVMEEAAKAGKPVFVLDRPNPINGVDTEGPIADADKLSFVVVHTIAVRHGMTIGELAGMFNAEKKIGADLRVIKMENWQRAAWFDQTNQTWINPSPNMRSLTEATLYPGIGLLETTNLSVGRGTDTPFEVIGAPWLDGQKLAHFLNQKNIPGVRFVPVRFKPSASIFKGEECGGVNIIIIDRQGFKPVRTGIEIAVALRKLFPTDWKTDNYNRLLANEEIFAKMKNGDTPDEIEKAWQANLDEFKKRRASFLLYKN